MQRIITPEKPHKCSSVVPSVRCTPQANVAESQTHFLPNHFGLGVEKSAKMRGAGERLL